MTLPSPERWASLSPLLDELLELQEPERSERLGFWQAQRPELAQELAALLADAASARAGAFLTGSLAFADHRAPGATLAGQKLGAYVLEAPLGEGGTGTVWRARRDDGRFEGVVAIKLLHLSLLGGVGAERFRREGSILARLEHPNIARLMDAGFTPGGQPYLVIELVQGERLDRHCNARHLDVDARLGLFRDVLMAVASAHSHLVVHRDIKPSNILVTQSGVVKLLDFGIAKIIEEESQASDTTDLTREWGRAMTPEYAAPEQLRGDSVTTATDVYALGGLLYELLTGQLPHPKRRRGPLHHATADLESEPVKPSTCMPSTALRRRIEGDLDTIVMRALKPSAGERYPTVSAMLEDVLRHLDGRPVLARADSWLYRASKFIGRNKGGSAVVAGVALALLGGAHAQVAVLVALAAGTLLASWQARSAQAQARAARLAQQRAEEVKKFIASIFTEAKPRDGQGGVVTAADLLTSAFHRIDAELGANPAVAGELGVLVAESCSRLGDVALGARALQAALPRCTQVYGAIHALTLQGRTLELEALNHLGDFDKAQPLLPALLADLRSQLPAQAARLSFALQESSYLWAKREDETVSLADAQEAVAVAELHFGPLHEQTLQAMGFLSNTWMHFSRYAQALSVGDQSMQRARQALAGQRPHSVLTELERSFADALVKVGRPGDAEPIARQVHTDQLALDTVMTARVVNAMTIHAMALTGMGRVDEGILVAQQVVVEHARLTPRENSDTAAFADRLAWSLLPTRRLDDVAVLLERSAQISLRLGREPHASTLRRQRVRAQLCAWRGQTLEMQELLDAAEVNALAIHAMEWARLARVQTTALRVQAQWAAGLTSARLAFERCVTAKALPSDHAHALTEWGLLLLDSGDVQGGHEKLLRAQQQFELGQVQSSVLTADTALGLGRCHLAAGRADEAHKYFASAERCWAASHAGSVWHAQAQHWLALALHGQAALQRNAQLGLRADELQAVCSPVLRASGLLSLVSLEAAPGR